MKPSNQNKAPDTVARAATCPTTVGEVLDLFLPRSVNVPAMLEHTDRARTEYRKILSAFIEQLRITNHRYYEEEDERREGFHTAAEMTNSKIDDMLR